MLVNEFKLTFAPSPNNTPFGLIKITLPVASYPQPAHPEDVILP